MYQVLLFVHIICADDLGRRRVLRPAAMPCWCSESTIPPSCPIVGERLEILGTRVFLPASILLFIAGAAMVAQQWSFGQTWVAVAIALWLLSALSGALYLGPRVKKMSELYEAEGPTSTAARAIMDRVFLVSRLELVSFAIIIFLMVFKPGAASA